MYIQVHMYLLSLCNQLLKQSVLIGQNDRNKPVASAIRATVLPMLPCPFTMYKSEKVFTAAPSRPGGIGTGHNGSM